MVSPGGFQRLLETSQAPNIVYSTVQLASYSLGATGSELSLLQSLAFIIDASFMPSQYLSQIQRANLMSIDLLRMLSNA